MRLNEKKIISVNGFNCKYHIWGDSEENPIIIFVHGGPGNPIRHKIKKYFLELKDEFTLVCYDQRGVAGSASAALSLDQITLDNLVDDLLVFADYLKNNSSASRIYLICESFGSLIGTLALKKRPELFSGYIAFGQFVSSFEAAKYQKAELEKILIKNRDYRVKEFLDTLPFDKNVEWSDEQAGLFSKYLYELVDNGRQNNWKKEVYKPIMRSCEYKGSEKKSWKNSNESYRNKLLKPWYDISNLEIAEEVPYFVFNGEYDFATPSPLAKEFVKKRVTNRDHKFILFENCAHSCAFEQPARFMVLVRKYFSPNRDKLLNKD